MKKIKNIYIENASEKLGPYLTGLYLEAEDGTWYSGASACPVKPFEECESPLTPANED